MIIPELAIHLQRDVKEKGPLVDPQEHMMPLISLQGSFPLETLLRRYVSFASLLSFDLFAVPIEPPRLLGVNSEMLASYRLDNLTSVHAAISAITSYEESEVLPLAVFWDHEEIGSLSQEGAMSSFLNDILLRIQTFYAMSPEQFLILKSTSLAISLDMGHGFNPMHGNKYDSNHQPLLGHGIALKSNAQMRYASSASTLARAKLIANKANIKVQSFAMRSDMPCGSTVGPAITASTGIATVDLGCTQFSMHSCREVIAVQDYLDLVTFLTQALKP
jgi:aspartyl aminopeptidase